MNKFMSINLKTQIKRTNMNSRKPIIEIEFALRSFSKSKLQAQMISLVISTKNLR